MRKQESDMTIEYYNNHAESFADNTRNVDLSENQMHFLDKLLPGASILDIGCGSGRDTRFFLDKGYQVTATDGSEELCKLASDYTGIPVKCMRFQELNDIGIYDGIWACSSILHLPYEELKDVMKKAAGALKERGIFYASFKYGIDEGQRNGRYFTDMTEEKFAVLLTEIPAFVLEEQWVTEDVRPERKDEKWLNVILVKEE